MMVRSSQCIVRTLAVVVVLVVGLAACGGGSDEPTAKPGAPTTTAGVGFTAAAAHAACVASARAIETAAALDYAKSGSYGTVADLVSAGFLRNAPDPSWGLTIGPDGTVDDSTCP
jgi:hypothetical protein